MVKTFVTKIFFITLLFFGLATSFPNLILAQCNAGNVNQCGVCPNPDEICAELLGGGYVCTTNSLCDDGGVDQNPTCNGNGIDSAIGCIPVYPPEQLASFVLLRGMSLGGGIALLMIGYAGIQIMMSGGDPQKLQGGKNLLTAAITGLLFLIFGAFLLQLIGVEILNIDELVAIP